MANPKPLPIAGASRFMCLRNNNSVSWLQREIALRTLALERVLVLKRNSRLLAVLRTQQVYRLQIGELRKTGARKRLQNGHSRQEGDWSAVQDFAGNVDALAVHGGHDYRNPWI